MKSYQKNTKRLMGFTLAVLVLTGLSILSWKTSRVQALDRDSNKALVDQKLGRVTLRAASHDKPFVNLSDGPELPIDLSRAAQLQKAFDLYQATALAPADFDEDGMPDLISGYSATSRRFATLRRGNVDSIFPNSANAERRKMTGEYTDSPFFAASLALELPEPANFLGAGNFDADGRCDLVAAAASGHALYLLRGDGHGVLAAARSVELPGRVTALVTGEINRDGGELNVVNTKEKRKKEDNEEEAREPESAAMSPDLLPSASGLVRATLSGLPQAQTADLALTISHSPDPVAAGETLTYTFTVTNTGPATVAVFIGTSTPVGTTLESSVPSAPASAAGRALRLGFVKTPVPPGGLAVFMLRVHVLAAPGSTITLQGLTSSSAPDPNPANNSASTTTEVQGGGIVNLRWRQRDSTDDDPTPAPEELQINPGTSPATIDVASERVMLPNATCNPVEHPIYISNSLPVPTLPSNLFIVVPSGQQITNAPNPPDGAFYAITTMWNCGGNLTESGTSNQVGVPGGPVVNRVSLGSKLKANGSGFVEGLQVFIDGVQFSKDANVLSSNKLKQKGGLKDGRSLDEATPIGRTVLVSFRNPDGGIGSRTFTQTP